MNSNLSDDEKLNLKKLMNEMDYVDNTETIRKLKHSVKIRDTIRKLEDLKRQHAQLRIQSPEQFFNIAHTECKFLYDNYSDIFRRLMKDEIDITIMTKLLIVLKFLSLFNTTNSSLLILDLIFLRSFSCSFILIFFITANKKP